MTSNKDNAMPGGMVLDETPTKALTGKYSGGIPENARTRSQQKELGGKSNAPDVQVTAQGGGTTDNGLDWPKEGGSRPRDVRQTDPRGLDPVVLT
jgi:hypothetical protein